MDFNTAKELGSTEAQKAIKEYCHWAELDEPSTRK
jgi:hypothetical protein